MAGIYIHIPFCGSFCTYCGFYSELCRNGGEMESFVAALEKEAAAQRVFFKNLQDDSVKTLYFGGGTPSVLPPGLFGRIYSAVSRNFDLTGVEEFTVEVNPEDILEEGGAQKIRMWKECGVNRISMGVQSFSDTHLKFMRRRHDAQGALRAFGILREAGFDNISIDLIFGYEGLSLSEWEYNLETAVRLAPEHISAYQMSIDGGSYLADMVDNGTYREPSAEACAEQYALLQDMLQAAGYNQYEISNFCRPGFHSRHNSAYWERVPYLGLGPAAHSFDGEAARFWNPSDLRAYCAGTLTREEEVLSDKDIYNETVMLGLRTVKGVPCETIEAQPPVEPLVYLEKVGNNYRIPRARLFVSDDIIVKFIKQ